MSSRMYQPDKKSKIHFYILIFTVILIAFGFYIYSQPLAVDSACSEVAEKTTGLTKSFNFDPLSDYDSQKAKCLEDALSSKK